MFKQAKWNEKLIFEYDESNIYKSFFKELSESEKNYIMNSIPEKILRRNPPNIPQLSEVETIRHFTRLSQMSYGVDLGVYPLGSCTMKYNPKVNEEIANNDKILWIHPYQDEETIQGVLKILYDLALWLAEIVGVDKVSLQPAAGAQAEFTGCLIMRAYHKDNNEENRTEILIPDSAHGTNPASAVQAGFKVVTIPSGDDGCIDVEALKSAVSARTAGLMLTNPNTLGIFEKNILEISKIIHEVGGLLYYDGANLNGILGKVRPGDMGFDIVHINIHKTFSAPHGGGGPGAGPIGVKKPFDEYLPVPTVEYDGYKYYLDYNKPKSIGKVKGFYGNINVLLKAAAYILYMGSEGLKKVSEYSVLNTNYFLTLIKDNPYIKLPFNSSVPRKHECVLSLAPLYDKTGVRALDIAKWLLDKGMHAPTIYFPLIVKEALMIEFTECESKENIEKYAETLLEAIKLAIKEPSKFSSLPQNTSVKRLDEVKANHPTTYALSWKMYKKKILSCTSH
ncbi:MAG: aminomethyl-transferring glycine dehydrogenase subunit GcvPB [Candidatus Methanomethylicia archaeon]